MNNFKVFLFVTLVSIATAELNITHNADETEFIVTGLKESSDLNRNSDTTVRPGQFPWHATLFTRQSGKWVFNSGVLISPRWVLTLATNLNRNSQPRIVIGSRFRSGPILSVERIVWHPRLRETRNPLFNIAALQLTASVPKAFDIGPIGWTRPTGNLHFAGSIARFTSFASGRPNRPLQRMIWHDLRITTEQNCRSAFPNHAGRFLLCGSGPVGSHSEGDSGSPVVWRLNNTVQLIGLVIASRDGRIAFLNVAAHNEWLSRLIN